MSAPALLASLMIIGLMLLPEWNSPIGRLGLDVAVLAMVLALLLRSVTLRDLARLLPLFLPALAFTLALAYALVPLGSPIFGGGLHMVGSWLRCASVSLVGLYLGRETLPAMAGGVVRTLMTCAVLVLLIGIAQRYSQVVRDITFALYWPSTEEANVDWNAVLASRPSSTTGRIFSFAFFCAALFLTMLASGAEPGRRIRHYVIMVLALIAMLATQTKGAVLAVMIGVLLLPLETRRAARIVTAIVGMLLVGAAITVAVNVIDFRRLQLFSLLLSGGFDDFSTAFKTDPNVVARINYLKVQWSIFLEHPWLGNMFLADKARFSDNLYVDTLAKGGLVGLGAVLAVPAYFALLFARFRRLAGTRTDLAGHLFLARFAMWAGFVAMVMGVTWNLFTGHRTMLLVYFLAGFIEGQYGRMIRNPSDIGTIGARLSTARAPVAST